MSAAVLNDRQVTLLDGRVLDGTSIDFNNDPSSGSYYHFFLGSEDITNELYRKDKLYLVPGFDVDYENRRLSVELGHGSRVGNTDALPDSTTEIFVDQLIHDPLAAPGEALSNTIKRATESVGFKRGAIILIIGVVLYLAIKPKSL